MMNFPLTATSYSYFQTVSKARFANTRCYIDWMEHFSIIRRGFTLIELMVVVAVIGILSSILYANFSDARNYAKNTAIQTEIKELKLALEFYRAQNGRYPLPSPESSGCGALTGIGNDRIHVANSAGCGSTPLLDPADPKGALLPEFIAELPSSKNSANPNCVMEYMTAPDGSWYRFTAKHCHDADNQPSQGIQPNDELAYCIAGCSSFCVGASVMNNADFYETYAIYSPGGQCRAY